MREADRTAAWDAARGRCAGCGTALGTAGVCHHRQASLMGGKRTRDDSPANVVVLHDFCHKWLHEHPTIARIHGLIVPSWGDPADVLPSTVPGLDGLRRGHNPR